MATKKPTKKARVLAKKKGKRVAKPASPLVAFRGVLLPLAVINAIESLGELLEQIRGLSDESLAHLVRYLEAVHYLVDIDPFPAPGPMHGLAVGSEYSLGDLAILDGVRLWAGRGMFRERDEIRDAPPVLERYTPRSR